MQKCCNDFIDKPIQKVTLSEIKKSLPNFIEMEYVNPKTNKNITKIYSQNVINKLYTLLNKGFKIAFSERIIPYTPMDNESIKKTKAKLETSKVETLTIEEQKTLISILKQSNHKYKNIILLALYTGMHIGEILAITRDNVNLKDNTLTRDNNDRVILGTLLKLKQEKELYF